MASAGAAPADAKEHPEEPQQRSSEERFGHEIGKVPAGELPQQEHGAVANHGGIGGGLVEDIELVGWFWLDGRFFAEARQPPPHGFQHGPAIAPQHHQHPDEDTDAQKQGHDVDEKDIGDMGDILQG
ncbi:MAG: hypothetical protein HC884_16540 [Chloroflexaceae bacterium]|nr:hypothetical protein [Chloroflexaceae bacterium]